MATQTQKKRPSRAKPKSSSDSSGGAPSASSKFDKWPAKGGIGGQPWDAAFAGLDTTAPEPGETKPMPVRPGHNQPILAAGSGGAEVRELGERLAVLGYPNSASDGFNPFNIFDTSLEVAVGSFCRDYDVQEDPTGFGGDNPQGRSQAAQHVGPWVWEAVIRASDREREKAA